MGGTNPISLSEYYTDASPGFARGVSGVPVMSNQISLSSFTGKSIPTVITLSNNGSPLTNYVVNFIMNYKSSYASTFQDLRFYDEATNTLLSHWYESVSNGSSATVWLRVPILANGTRVKVSTGNSSSTGNANNVFPLYEDFSSFDTVNKWLVSSGSYSSSTNNFQFTTTNFTYLVTRSNYPGNIRVDASIRSSSGNAIPEIIMRGDTGNNTGIKVRGDCRTIDSGGTGSLLNTPFNNWNFLGSAPSNFSFPSNGTFQTLSIQAVQNSFSTFYNNTNTVNLTDSSTGINNSNGVIGFANHNGIPITCQWIRAYPATSNNITVSIS